MKKMANASLDDFNHCKCYGTNKSFFVTVRKNREFEYREIIQLMCATNKVEHIETVYINILNYSTSAINFFSSYKVLLYATLTLLFYSFCSFISDDNKCYSFSRSVLRHHRFFYLAANYVALFRPPKTINHRKTYEFFFTAVNAT